MRLSNVIEDFIKEMIAQSSGEVELKRNELANQFGCVPSQINYVISTRFSPERGYIVESRRGGGGYIKITRVLPQSGSGLMHVVNAVGETISETDAMAIVENCFDYDFISQKEAKIMTAAVSDKSIPIKQPERDIIRAIILKNMIINAV